MSSSVGALEQHSTGYGREAEYILSQLKQLGMDCDALVSEWKQSERSRLLDHLVEAGVLKGSARQLIAMMERGYANIPFSEIVADDSGTLRGTGAVTPPATPAEELTARGSVPPAPRGKRRKRLDTQRTRRITLHSPSGVDGDARRMLGVQLGPYEIDQALGEGASSLVYRALDTRSNNFVTLKVLRQSAVLRHPALAGAFAKEAELLQSVEHPAILKGLDSGRDKGFTFIACEYFAPLTLESFVESMGPMPCEKVVLVGQQVSSALAYLSSRGVSHRDLAPQNILVYSSDCRVRLCDFGTAHVLAPRIENEERVHFGNPSYMAPEVILEPDPDASRADMYALGATLFFAATGRPPFVAETALEIIQRQVNDDPPAIESLVDSLDPRLVALVTRLLAKSPTSRFDDWRQIEVALEEIA